MTNTDLLLAVTAILGIIAFWALVIWGVSRFVNWNSARIDAQCGITRDKTGRIIAYVPVEKR